MLFAFRWVFPSVEPTVAIPCSCMLIPIMLTCCIRLVCYLALIYHATVICLALDLLLAATRAYIYNITLTYTILITLS